MPALSLVMLLTWFGGDWWTWQCISGQIMGKSIMISHTNWQAGIIWDYPPPSKSRVITRIIPFLVGNPNLNLHLWLASWEGAGTPRYQLSLKCATQNHTNTVSSQLGFPAWLRVCTAIIDSSYIYMLKEVYLGHVERDLWRLYHHRYPNRILEKVSLMYTHKVKNGTWKWWIPGQITLS